jgi:hypothetical protein
MRGGSGEPMLRFGCLIRLTEARTEELRDFTGQLTKGAGRRHHRAGEPQNREKESTCAISA